MGLAALLESQLRSVELVVLGAVVVHLRQRHGVAEEGVPPRGEVHPPAQ